MTRLCAEQCFRHLPIIAHDGPSAQQLTHLMLADAERLCCATAKIVKHHRKQTKADAALSGAHGTTCTHDSIVCARARAHATVLRHRSQERVGVWQCIEQLPASPFQPKANPVAQPAIPLFIAACM